MGREVGRVKSEGGWVREKEGWAIKADAKKEGDRSGAMEEMGDDACGKSRTPTNIFSAATRRRLKPGNLLK